MNISKSTIHPLQTIAIIDDNADFCLLLKKFLIYKGYDVFVFTSSVNFLKECFDDFDIVLLDLFMPDPDGITVIRTLASQCYTGSVLLMSGEDHGVLRAALELAKAQRLPRIQTINKPFALDNLQSQLLNLLADTYSHRHKSPAMDAWIPTTSSILDAIELQQLQLFYQPKICLENLSLSGFEALLRWNHPQHGLIMPDRFIYLAEQSSQLMHMLTQEVIRLAVDQLSLWKTQGYTVQLSINVSMLNLVNLDFPDVLLNLLKKKYVEPAQLLLEVTETALMSEVSTSLDILLRLRMKGFSLSIDDFGTGYSSLAQLHRIPFSELKIDRSFVMTIKSCDESKAIVETCIKLGKRLGLQVVAEGVENDSVLQELKVLGCEVGQGYFWSKPLPACELTNWLVK